MPTPAGSLSAVIVSGGKQYRVRPGDRILVDRIAGEPGSELTLDRVLLLADGDDVKIGAPAVESTTVTARVVGPARGPKIDVLRYKSKKRVRVHRGARADLTALEILTVGGRGVEKEEKKAARPARRAASKPEPDEVAETEASAVEAKPARRRAAAKPAAAAASKAPAKAPAKPAKKKSEETGDGA